MTSSLDDDRTKSRRRESPDSLRISREALRVLRPVNEKIGIWQSDSIRLITSAERLRASGRHEPGVTEGIRTLLGTIEQQTRQFEAGLEGHPPDIVTHSRVADTRRVLGMLAERLQQQLGAG